MNLATIAARNLRHRLLASSLTALSVALGVMLMVSVLLVMGIVNRAFGQRSIGYDLVVGPKGSELQLVLAAVYRVQPPAANLPYKYLLELQRDPAIEEAVPLAFGDTTEQGGFPIVGTTERFFELPYAPKQEFRIRNDGRGFREAFDALIGHHVARANGWTVGSTFKMVHGGAESDHVHDEVFTVVGVLAPTGTANDKTVFIHLNGFYAVAGHDKPLVEALRKDREFFGPNADNAALEELERRPPAPDVHHHGPMPDVQKEVTAILVRMKRPPGEPPDTASAAALMFAGRLKKESIRAQAVNPIIPMQWLMTAVVGNVQKVLLVLTGLIVAVSGVGIFVSIYNSMADRRKEIAVMRALGASRPTVFAIVLCESILLCVGGGLLGMLLGHGLVFAAAPIVAAETGLLVSPWYFDPTELRVIPALIAMASLVGLVPAMTAFRTDVARTLAS